MSVHPNQKAKKARNSEKSEFLAFYMRTICFLIWEVAFDSLF